MLAITAARRSYAPVVTANGEAVGLAIAGGFGPVGDRER
jgi:hypothetical protein